MEIKLKLILKGRCFSFTTDGWSSINHKACVACIVRGVDIATWELHSMVMGLFKKKRRSFFYFLAKSNIVDIRSFFVK